MDIKSCRVYSWRDIFPCSRYLKLRLPQIFSWVCWMCDRFSPVCSCCWCRSSMGEACYWKPCAFPAQWQALLVWSCLIRPCPLPVTFSHSLSFLMYEKKMSNFCHKETCPHLLDIFKPVFFCSLPLADICIYIHMTVTICKTDWMSNISFFSNFHEVLVMCTVIHSST